MEEGDNDNKKCGSSNDVKKGESGGGEYAASKVKGLFSKKSQSTLFGSCFDSLHDRKYSRNETETRHCETDGGRRSTESYIDEIESRRQNRLLQEQQGANQPQQYKQSQNTSLENEARRRESQVKKPFWQEQHQQKTIANANSVKDQYSDASIKQSSQSQHFNNHHNNPTAALVNSSESPTPSKIGSPFKSSQFLFATKEFLHKSNSDPLTRTKRLYGPSYYCSSKPFQMQNIFKQHRRGPPVSKCMLKLDGYSYVIVASPPEKPNPVEPSTSTHSSSASKNGQLSKQGSLTILRRCSSKTLSGRSSRLSYSDDQVLDSIDLDSENLPPTDSPEATEKAALRLRVLLRRLRQGEIPASALQKNLQYAADVLEAALVEDTKRLGEDEDELSEVEPDAVPPEVREWLASTFTKQLQGGRRRNEEKPKFRSVANAIRAGIFVERIYRRLSSATFSQLPPEVTRVLKRVDDWNFNVWLLHEVSVNTPLRCLGYEFLNRYGLLHKFKVPPASLETFLSQVETGYCKYKNPYHNNIHAADVLQTIHYMLSQTGLMNWLTDIEVFATLFAALVHDLEHTGTTNNFHVMSGTDTALLYNDRAVLENHHISAAFRLLKGEETNILVNLSREEYREFRSLVIDMVLATDMSSHFQQIKAMKTLLALPEPTLDKSKALSLTLHCCDISHPSKEWSTHERWTMNLLEEFFRQGDKEKELGLPYSPLCDRNNTLVAESQIGFIEFIVEPSMSVCGDLLNKISELNSSCNTTITEESTNEPGGPIKRPIRPANEVRRPWNTCLTINKQKWKERATRDAEERAKMENENDTKDSQEEDKETSEI